MAVLTFDPVVHSTFWLFTDYVPEVNALPSAQVLGPDAVAEVIGADRVEAVPVPSDCVDGFNWAFWRRPEHYLDPEVRACMSGLAMLPTDLVAQRMEHLRADLADGTWHARHGHLLHRTPSTEVCGSSHGHDPRLPRAWRWVASGECGPMSDGATNAATKGAGEWVWRVST